MACGGCAQRRQQLAGAVKAVVAGDGRKAADLVKTAGASFKNDTSAFVQRAAAAKLRLTRR